MPDIKNKKNVYIMQYKERITEGSKLPMAEDRSATHFAEAVVFLLLQKNCTFIRVTRTYNGSQEC